MGSKKNNNPKDPMTNTRSMAREGMRIMKDIAFGKYNIYTEGHIFRNLEFVRATIAEVDKRLMDCQIHINAIRYAYQNNSDSAIANLLYRDERSYEAYTLIRSVLYNILMSNGDTGFLLVLANKLPQFKYNI